MTACGAQLEPKAFKSAAACSDKVITSGTSQPNASGRPIAVPSLQLPQQPAGKRLQLTADSATVPGGGSVVLTATADRSVTGTGQSIEIFDTTTGDLIGVCSAGNQCAVAYVAHFGKHSFGAYLTPPTTKIPDGSALVASNAAVVNWVGVTLTTDKSAIGPGHAITLAATSSQMLDRTGWLLQVYDRATGARIGYCGSGNGCQTSVTSGSSRSLDIVAMIAPASRTLPANSVVIARSSVLKVTWLSVAVRAVTNNPTKGGVVQVMATANADISGTGWSIGIFDARGQMVGACSKGAMCRVDVTMDGSSLPSYKAAVGYIPATTSGLLGGLVTKLTTAGKMVDLQATSALVLTTVQPRILWGVDSCKSITSDSTAATGLYPNVTYKLGAPAFWGRYLTETVCPAISSAEISLAHKIGMGILPIYNDYDCSAVAGYDTGHQYGTAAAAAAASLGIPGGVALAIDIEPPGAACPGAGSVDSAFVGGWFDAVYHAGYVPAYYGNGVAGSPFASAYCVAVGAQPAIGSKAHLWSYEPSLLGGFNKDSFPDWGYVPSAECPENATGWQFVLSAGSDPDVDQDLVSSDFPLWRP